MILERISTIICGLWLLASAAVGPESAQPPDIDRFNGGVEGAAVFVEHVAIGFEDIEIPAR